MADTDPVVMAKLNEVSEFLNALNAGRIRDLIRPGSRFDQVAGCTGNCDCKGGYCGCNASVTASDRFGTISYPEFMQIREARMAELRAELDALELPERRG